MSFGIWELSIVLLIVALLFGTKKLRTLGSDLGGALKGFRSAFQETESLVEDEDERESASTEQPKNKMNDSVQDS